MKFHAAHHGRCGFTLVEISIVLVIIGLISGAILGARELIENARIRKQIAELREYSTALNAFRNKYHCIAGDCARSEELGLDDGTGLNGDNSGRIDTMDEAAFLWHHLYKAGLHQYSYPTVLPYVPGTNSPALVYPGSAKTYTLGAGDQGFNAQGGVWYADAVSIAGTPRVEMGNAWVIWSTLDNNLGRIPAIYPGVLSPRVSIQYDMKLDDGFPRTGRVLAFTHSSNMMYYDNTNQVITDPVAVSASSCLTPFVNSAQRYQASSNNMDSPSAPANSLIGTRCVLLISTEM